MTPDEIEHITAALERIETKVDGNTERLDKLNGKVHILELFKAKAEGIAIGSRWTLAALSLVVGIVGGGGLVFVLRGL